MNLNFKTLKKDLTKENIELELKRNGYNEYDLARYYISGFKKFNEHMKSDLRDNDKNNSMICRVRGNKLCISDFGYRVGMDIYGYLMDKLYNNSKDSFRLVLDTIRQDFRLDNILPLPKAKTSLREFPIKYNEEVVNSDLPVKIEVKRRKFEGNLHWTYQDEEYWESFGISIKKLEEKGIAPLETFWITNYNKDGVRREYNLGYDLGFVYPFYRNSKGNFMYKLYLPLGFKGNKDFKWISNVNKKVVQNYQFLPKTGDLLILQSSFKDIMVMEELFPGLNIISFNGEGIWCENFVWEELKNRFSKQVLFANNDYTKKNNPGLTMARKHCLKYNIPFVCTPDGTTSDISDYYKKYGKEETIKFLNQVFYNINLILYG